MSQNRIFIILSAVLLIVFVGWVWGNKFSTPEVQAFEFWGNITDIDGDALFVKGFFYSSENPEIGKGDETFETKIILGKNTQITRIKKYLPTEEKLKKTEGRFNPEELETEKSVVTIQDLAGDFDKYGPGRQIKVKSDKNIYRKSKFKATEIEYSTPFLTNPQDEKTN